MHVTLPIDGAIETDKNVFHVFKLKQLQPLSKGMVPLRKKVRHILMQPALEKHLQLFHGYYAGLKSNMFDMCLFFSFLVHPFCMR